MSDDKERGASRRDELRRMHETDAKVSVFGQRGRMLFQAWAMGRGWNSTLGILELEAPWTPLDLGGTLLEAVKLSVSLDPPGGATAGDALLARAGVGSDRELGRKWWIVSANRRGDGRFTFTPMRPHGASWSGDHGSIVVREPTAESLGEALEEAIARARRLSRR